jgi:hypothetical protein
MGPFLDTLLTTLGVWIPRIIAALVILLIGWIIAKIVAAIVRKIVGLLKIDARLGKSLEGSDTKMPSLEGVIVGIFYWIIMIFAVIAALNALGMVQIAAFFTAFLTPLFAYLPQLAAGAVLVLVAWLVATILRGLVVRVLHGVGVDKKVNDQADMGALPISGAIGEAVYWLVWLLFLPGILGVLGMAGLAVPVQNMINELLAFVPKLLAAAIILIIGIFVARILQRITASALHAFGADALSDRVGLSRILGKPNLSGLLGYIVYIIVFIPVVIAALNALGLTYLAAPLSEMLTQVLLVIPKLFAAAVILGIAFVIARVIADLITNLLSNAGFDNLMVRVSLGEVSAEGRNKPSQIVGMLIIIVIMLFAAMAAAGMLGWASMVVILGQFIAFLARLLLALIVLVVGVYLANLAAKVILSTNLEQKRLLALLARVAIIIFAAIMALEQTGIANSIVDMAFGLLLAGVALAAALAFGLGGKDVAKYQLVRWYKSAEVSLAVPQTPEATLEEEKPAE